MSRGSSFASQGLSWDRLFYLNLTALVDSLFLHTVNVLRFQIKCWFSKNACQNGKQERPRSDLKQSDLGLPCLSKPFWKANSIQNVRAFTVHFSFHNYILKKISQKFL